uniref:Uncharacterized protein n=1 Tax=Mycena chlorophos TaxID=658473 RepID=A0ABQ0KX42_MYCCL|nr:predicted protein [Mycena chlorophos]
MDFSGTGKLNGWEPSDLRDHSFFELVNRDESAQIRQLHHYTIVADKAACVVYMRLKHKDAHKGYILCAVSRFVVVKDRSLTDSRDRTTVYDCVVGSVSYARPGGEILRTASTAQEVIAVAPAASNLRWRRWHEAAQPVPTQAPSRQPEDLPSAQSTRTAFILDRFSTNCIITQYTTDSSLYLPHDDVRSSTLLRATTRRWLARQAQTIAIVGEQRWQNDAGRRDLLRSFGRLGLYSTASTGHPMNEFISRSQTTSTTSTNSCFSSSTTFSRPPQRPAVCCRRLGSRDDALVKVLLGLGTLSALVGRRKRLFGVVGRRISPDWSLRIGRTIRSSMLRRENRGAFIVASQLSSAEACCYGREAPRLVVASAGVWNDLGRVPVDGDGVGAGP